ncbi:hypothetical protein EXIGLDRAFT_421382 [Exidia glandulosa HHB12029]|uniref:Uncharacterized protein n=1 Tax=Exidia glandulosa HHB12029 TaxID=1314781 RepID=A0A166AZT6_EXIGL|nr:hypothetical protein EXIGLDRAFT_421382 [Exidia glandulosa HHB12029]
MEGLKGCNLLRRQAEETCQASERSTRSPNLPARASELPHFRNRDNSRRCCRQVRKKSAPRGEKVFWECGEPVLRVANAAKMPRDRSLRKPGNGILVALGVCERVIPEGMTLEAMLRVSMAVVVEQSG